MRPWCACVNVSLAPTKTLKTSIRIARFDFAWMVDSDLLLEAEALNFGVFLDIIQKLDFWYCTVSHFRHMCYMQGQRSLPHLSKISEPDSTVIAKTASIVEATWSSLTGFSRQRWFLTFVIPLPRYVEMKVECSMD